MLARLQLQVVARERGDAASVWLAPFLFDAQAQLNGFKARALKPNLRVSEERRWHYEIEWSRAPAHVLQASTRLDLLVIGSLFPTLASHTNITVVQRDSELMLANGRFDAVVLTTSLYTDSCASWTELRLVEAALRLMQAQMLLDNAPPVWLYTMATQLVSPQTQHAGLWGLARACRQERATLPAWCLDVHNDARGIATVIRQQTLRLPSGSVRGLHLSPSVEAETAMFSTTLHVPRLVAPFDSQPVIVDVALAAVCRLLDAHTSDAMAALDTARLLPAYALLESLCQQYLHEAVDALQEFKVPLWHHKLLWAWCAKQPPPSNRVVASADVRTAHPDLWAEVQLAERLGAIFQRRSQA